MEEYICRVASINDVIKKYDEEIEKESNKEDLIKWKEMTIDRINKNQMITYIGLLNNKIVSECSTTLDKTLVENSDNLIDENTAYLHGFYTKENYQNKGYFSKLFKYMINDLKLKGYKKVTLGVEPNELKNKAIYNKYGFTEYIKSVPDICKDGTKIDVEYYAKRID